MKRKRCRRLTAKEKKVIWAEPTSNAGAGWTPIRDPHYMPRPRWQNRKRDTTVPLDKEIVK